MDTRMGRSCAQQGQPSGDSSSWNKSTDAISNPTVRSKVDKNTGLRRCVDLVLLEKTRVEEFGDQCLKENGVMNGAWTNFQTAK